MWIEDLILNSTGIGLAIEIQGSVSIPTPAGRRIPVGTTTIGTTSSLVYSDKIPFVINMDSQGRLFGLNGETWDPAL